VVLLQEEVDRLKLQLGECTVMVRKLQNDLQSCCWPLTDAVAHAACNTDDEEENVGDADEGNLTRQMQSSSTQTSTTPSEAEAASAESNHQIQMLQIQLQNSIQESKSYLDTILEYKETISSLTMEVTRSQMYNEEIVTMLHGLREECDVLKIRLLDYQEKERMEVETKEEEEVVVSDENNNDLLLTQAVVEEKDDEVMEASSEDESHNGDDEVTCRDSDVTATATATDTMITTDTAIASSQQTPYSVFQHSQSAAPPPPTRLTKLLHNHLLSCIKLPLRLISVLFSIWITIILLRIGMIFFFIVVDNHYPIGWDRMINSPGIY
jgi:hypothetical protein